MPYPLTIVTDVSTAGTAVQISNTPRRVLSITFINPGTNTGNVYIGNDGTADVSVTTGVTLERGQSFTFDYGKYGFSVPISDHWVDAAVNGEDIISGLVMFT